MLIKIIYILVVAIADFLLYSVLNKTGKVNSKLLWSFCGIFLLVLVLHIGLFNFGFLMSFRQFLLVSQFLVELIIFHFVGKYYINRTQKSTRLSGEVANFSIKMASFIYQKAIYVLIFIVQCVYIFSDIQ